MPDLDRYAKQTSSGEDASGSEFKSFEITDSSSPYPQVNVHGMYTNVFNNLVRK